MTIWSLLLLTAASARAGDASCPDGGYWPGAAWPDRTEDAAAMRPEAIAALDAFLFDPALDRSDRDRRGVRTDGIVVVHRGAIVYERYGGGYERSTPHLAWSATKTFTNALIGVAVRDGLVSLDDSVCEHLTAPDDACVVTVQHLLEFASGFDWRETYEGVSPTASSVLAMLYGEGHADMASFVLGHHRRDPPGATWMYSSGDTNVLSAIAGATLGVEHGDRYPWEVLLEPIGMRATWERDGAGTYVGSSYLWATPRDLARFGQLWLMDGCWQGERILPEGWVAESTRVSKPMRTRALGRREGDVQGRQVWLNRTVPELGQDELPWPGVPEGAYAALGHWKQSITVVPQAELVVVRTADDRDGTYEHARTLRLALQLVGAAAEEP